MREILFRGKTVGDNELVYGYLFVDQRGAHYICDTNNDGDGGVDMRRTLVKSETVGQYTGSKDTNDTKIFEGDIVYSVREEELAVIKWDDFTARFIVEFDGIVTDFDNYYASDLEVIGNIHDNPELLAVTNT